MIKVGPDEKVYPVTKVATISNALAAEGVSLTDALEGVNVSKCAMSSPATRVSLNQVIQCCRNAARLTRDPRFAYHAGLQFHVSTYGMYGFAILSSTNFRDTMRFAANYHQLATPLAAISFAEQDGRGIWTIVPIAHPRIDAALYRFLVELQFGIHVSLHRDIMGPSFAAQEVHVTYAPPPDASTYPDDFGCKILFAQPENELLFDAAWLERAPPVGNEISYSMIVHVCDELMDGLQLGIGLAGKVRELLLVNLMRPTSFEAAARHLGMPTRTLRRKLHEENTSFRKLIDELRMNVAIQYLRDTDLTNEDIACALGFSDGANFRHAFQRWTQRVPQDFRNIRRA